MGRTAIRWAALVVLLAGGQPAPAGAQAVEPPPLAVPDHLRPVVVPSPVAGTPAYVLVEGRFQRVVTTGGGEHPTVYLEFVPAAEGAGDPRWHALWFRPCETHDVVAGFVEASLSPDEPVQIALPVNPPASLHRALTTTCQAGGYRTPSQSERYAASLFATNLQSLRGQDAGVYVGGSLNSLVRLGRITEARGAAPAGSTPPPG